MKKLVALLLFITALYAPSQAWADVGYRHSQAHNVYTQPYNHFNRFDSPHQRRHFHPQYHRRFYERPHHYRYWVDDSRDRHNAYLSRCSYKRFR
ncbi:MAG: hypothetical protein HOP23_09720 [Methylococcaceae bacterium]|nr:hypothetical protein [Methylococcaceae bacterium]